MDTSIQHEKRGITTGNHKIKYLQSSCRSVFEYESSEKIAIEIGASD